MLDRLPEIKEAGITAVMLTPVTLSGEGLGPFGRAPFSFFAPDPQMATSDSPEGASLEMKILVKELHARGIEVYLQVQYSYIVTSFLNVLRILSLFRPVLA